MCFASDAKLCSYVKSAYLYYLFIEVDGWFSVLDHVNQSDEGLNLAVSSIWSFMFEENTLTSPHPVNSRREAP